MNWNLLNPNYEELLSIILKPPKGIDDFSGIELKAKGFVKEKLQPFVANIFKFLNSVYYDPSMYIKKSNSLFRVSVYRNKENNKIIVDTNIKEVFLNNSYKHSIYFKDFISYIEKLGRFVNEETDIYPLPIILDHKIFYKPSGGMVIKKTFSLEGDIIDFVSYGRESFADKDTNCIVDADISFTKKGHHKETVGTYIIRSYSLNDYSSLTVKELEQLLSDIAPNFTLNGFNVASTDLKPVDGKYDGEILATVKFAPDHEAFEELFFNIEFIKDYLQAILLKDSPMIHSIFLPLFIGILSGNTKMIEYV